MAHVVPEGLQFLPCRVVAFNFDSYLIFSSTDACGWSVNGFACDTLIHIGHYLSVGFAVCFHMSIFVLCAGT